VTKAPAREGVQLRIKSNDGIILGEAACKEVPVLITSDRHLLDIPRIELLQELKQRDLFTTISLDPKEALERFA